MNTEIVSYMSDDPFGAGREPGEQGSIEWLMERVGCCTASRFRDVLAKLKGGGPAKARADYLWELVVERLTGQPGQHYESAAMQWGTEQESAARMAYEAATGAMVYQTGFRRHPAIERLGGSPDGLVEPKGGFEAKCPFNSANHLQTWLAGMPDEHTAQVQGLMWLECADWWDFCSYDPRMPPDLQLYIQRIQRDDAYIARLEAEVIVFLGEVEALAAKLEDAAKRAKAKA